MEVVTKFMTRLLNIFQSVYLLARKLKVPLVKFQRKNRREREESPKLGISLRNVRARKMSQQENTDCTRLMT